MTSPWESAAAKLGVTALVLATIAVGCGPSGGNSAKPSASTSASVAPSAAVELPPIPAVIPGDPSLPWTALAASMNVAGGAVETSPVRYALEANCPLTYASRTVTDMVMDGKDKTAGAPVPSGMFGEADFSFSRDVDDSWNVKLDRASTGFIVGGVRTPGVPVPGPAAKLSSDGRRLSDLTKDPSVWLSQMSSPGVAIYFPDLPGTTVPNGATPWRIPALLKANPPEATVTSSGWITVKGEPAVILRATMSLPIGDEFGEIDDKLRQQTGQGPRPTTPMSGGQLELRAEYIVLASGRVLHASVDIETVVVAITGTEPTTWHRSWRGQLRLVKACRGAVVPAFSTTRPPAEIVLATISELEAAAASADEKKVAAYLSTELRFAQPKAAGVLIAHAKRYGPLSLGILISAKVNTRGDGRFIVLLAGIAQGVGGGRASSNPNNRIDGLLTDGHFVISKILSTSSSKGEILVIHEGRAFSTAETDQPPL